MKNLKPGKFVFCVSFLFFCLSMQSTILSQEYIVKEAEGNAEIIISEKPTRMGKFAAEELQEYIEKISGAKIPIITEKTETDNIKIYVGKSSYTDEMNITAEGLDHGGFHIRSGEKQLVLLGNDADFVPPKPWARHNGYKQKTLEEWDKITRKYTDQKWGNPVAIGLHKHFNKKTGWWEYDKHGSLNAVNYFLDMLGVKWYMPGILGEIVPSTKDIPLIEINKKVTPTFPMRSMLFAKYGTTPMDNILWYLRLGLNKGKDTIGYLSFYSHGLRKVHSRPEMKKEHPEYFALWGGKRMNGERGSAKPCLSSKGLMKENINYARAIFDIYDVPIASAMPEDGYARPCECENCKELNLFTPERGYNGLLSDYVWHYVNEVAKEVYKTHPDRKISCAAYGAFALPPLKIKKFSPNVSIGFTHARSGNLRDPEIRKNIAELRQQWVKLSGNKLIISEHYPFTHRGTFWPAYFPHQIAKSLYDVKNISIGEFIEVPTAHETPGMGHSLHTPGFSHLNIYVTAKMYWDVEQDVEPILNEYYKKFYGPAANEMKAFIEFCEPRWRTLKENPEHIEKILNLLESAFKKTDPNSDYGKRIDLVQNYLKPLKALGEQLKKGREGVPELAVHGKRFKQKDIVIDGKLDDALWSKIGREFERAANLKEPETGREAGIKTYFKAALFNNNLYFGIKCTEPDMENINSKGTKNDDSAIWNGDTIEILIETQSHSYYQLAINPDGILTDLDRKGGMFGFQWDSGAEISTHQDKKFWSIEIRIPISIGDMAGDPYHDVVGRIPKKDFPWFFNIGRQRIREGKKEFTVFSPTGDAGFHESLKFGKLYRK